MTDSEQRHGREGLMRDVLLFGATPTKYSAWRRRRRLARVELAALSRALPALGVCGPGVAVFQRAYDDLVRLPSSVVAHVLGTPHALVWLRRCFECIEVLTGRDPASRIARHLLPGQTPAAFADELFAYAGVLGVAAALLSGSSVTLPVALPLRRPTTLPGTDFHLRPTGSNARLLGCAGDPIVAGSDVVRLRRVTMGGRAVTIDPFDALLRTDAREEASSACDDVTIQRFEQMLGDAIALLTKHVPAVLGELDLAYESMAPSTFGGPSGFPSGTTSSSLGFSVFSMPPIPSVLCEMLVHEVSHSHLFVLQDLDPLLDPRYHGEGWEPEVLYSPWRDDPRPLNGLLHAAFVFARVARFWLRVAGDGTTDDRGVALRRLAVLQLQLGVVVRSLARHAQWTDTGLAFFTILRDEIDAVCDGAALLGLDEVTPFYAEDASTGRGTGSARDRQRAHFEAWSHRNPTLDQKTSRSVEEVLAIP